MRTSPHPFLGLSALAALLVGCGGGGGASASSPSSTVNVAGGAQAEIVTVDSPIAAGNEPSTVILGGESAVVPAGTAIPAGYAAILSTPTRLFGLSGTGAFTVDGHATGVSLVDGRLGAKIVLAPSAATTLRAVAPTGGFQIGTGANALTITGSFELGVPVMNYGTAGVPTAVSGTVPANGGRAASSTLLTATYPAAFASGYQARLTLNFAGTTMTQTRSIGTDGKVTFSPSSGASIPGTGVERIRLELVPN